MFDTRVRLDWSRRPFVGGEQITVEIESNSRQDSTTLWLGGIPPGTRMEEIMIEFGRFGSIVFAKINESKGK